MTTFDQTFLKHSISKLQLESAKHLLISRLPLFTDSDIEDDSIYAFRAYLDNGSVKYFDTELSKSILDYLEANAATSINALKQFSSEISKAGFTLLRNADIGMSDELLTIDSPDEIAKFDAQWHPAYQRTCEHMFNHFIKVPLYILGQNRGKNYLSLSLSNRSKIVQDQIFSGSTKGFNSIVRNAISHGGIEYLHGTIRYVDSHNTTELYPSEFAKLLDAIIDECGAYLFAFTLFITRQCRRDEKLLPSIPLIQKYLLLSGKANHPRLNIRHLYESVTIKNDHQLNIQCKIGSKSRTVHLFECLYIAFLTQKMFQNAYARIAISIECGGVINASLFINGRALLQSIESGKTLEESVDVLETNMLWYNASSFFRRIYFWLSFFPIQKQIYFHNLYEKWEEIGITATKDRYKIRFIENRSAGKLARSDAIIVLSEGYSYDLDTLLKVIRHAKKRIRKERVRRISIPKQSVFKHKPIHFWFRIFIKDRRLRELRPIENINTSLLVSKVEWIKNPRKIQPIMVKNPDIIDGKLRIVFNPEYVNLA